MRRTRAIAVDALLRPQGWQASDDCAALREIIFMPQTGVPSWYMLPPETGPESGRDLLVSLARLANR
jgi:hypothetical protein